MRNTRPNGYDRGKLGRPDQVTDVSQKNQKNAIRAGERNVSNGGRIREYPAGRDGESCYDRGQNETECTRIPLT